MDISRDEQRVLHALAQGGRLLLIKNSAGRIDRFELYTRDGWLLPVVTPELFRKLKRRRAIASHDAGPYQITRRGLELVRSEFDNR
jgi:uncharacterized protein